MRKFKGLICLVMATIMICTFAACGSTPKEDEVKTLVLGTSADYAPYEFHKMVDGTDTIVGFDIELAKEIAKDAGYNLEIKDIGFDSLLIEMNQGKVDFVISGMTPTDERKEEADFSDIYYTAEQCVIIRKADESKYTDIASLSGLSVGAQTGSIQEGMVQNEMPESTLVSLQKIPDIVTTLKAGKVEAIVMEKPVAEGYINENDDLFIAFSMKDDVGGSAVAVKKGNTALLDIINKTIERVTTDGTFDQFVIDATTTDSAE